MRQFDERAARITGAVGAGERTARENRGAKKIGERYMGFVTCAIRTSCAMSMPRSNGARPQSLNVSAGNATYFPCSETA